MDVKLRPGRPEDVEACGRICFEAFGTIASEHTVLPGNWFAGKLAM
jgi:hypothetical protein